jgi:hypothetical protein
MGFASPEPDFVNDEPPFGLLQFTVFEIEKSWIRVG